MTPTQVDDPVTAPDERFCTPQQLSAKFPETRPQFWRTRAVQGDILAFRLGPRIFFRWSDVVAWLEGQQVDGPCAARDPRRNGRRPTGKPKATARRSRSR